MRILKVSFLTLLSLTLFVTACKKDKTNTELLRAKPWSLVSLTVDPPIFSPFPLPGMNVTDVYAQMLACKKDDLITFKDGTNITYDEGATKCATTDPQTTTGTYSINTTETIVTVGTTDWTIKSITDAELVVTYKGIGALATNTYTATYK